MLSNDQIFKWEREFRISQAVIQYLSNSFTDTKELEQLLKSITHPAQSYYLRINLTKITQEGFLHQWNSTFPDFPGEIFPLPNTLKIPVQGPHSISQYEKIVYCDKFAAEAVLIGADLYLPGVCGTKGKFPAETPVSIYLSPSKIPSQWKDQLENLPIASGITALSSKEYVTKRKGIFVKNFNPKFQVAKYRNHSFYTKGLISGQTLPPIYAMGCLIGNIYKIFEDSLENIKIFDTCAAPGHKSTAMVEWAHYFAKKANITWNPTILSIDRSANRLKHLENDILRLGLSGITPLACKLEHIDQKHHNLHQQADIIMFDPPCSALGNRPKVFIEENKITLERYSKNQIRLLPFVDQLLKPGGFLMYNTCTLAVEENEAIIERLVTKYNYEIFPLAKSLPKPLPSLGHQGLPMPSFSKADQENLIRFSPTKGNNNGYFIALLQKKTVM